MEYKIKPGDWIKIKKKYNPLETNKFWTICGGKIFKILNIFSRDSGELVYKLDFRDVYTPRGNGWINWHAIERVVNNDIVNLQDELFQL